MKTNVLRNAALLVGLGAVSLGGCAMEVGSQESPLGSTEASLKKDDGTIHPGCEAFLKQCRDGKEKGCAKYSQRCEVRIGVVGDSLSDEYQGFVGLPGVQWTSQVQADQRISLGTPESDPAEPRNDGLSTNWARYGQAALDLQWSDPNVQAAYTQATGRPADNYHWDTIGSVWNQVNGLAGQIAAGQVDVALVWLGHNDLFISQVYGTPGYADANAFYTALVTRIVTIALALDAAGQADPNDPKVKVAIVGLAGDAAVLNPSLAAAAGAYGIPFIDPFNTVVDEMTYSFATTGAFTVGGTPLYPFDANGPRTALPSDLTADAAGPCGYSPLGYGCATPAYAYPFRHWDGTHPNTIYMGLVGNQILRDVNSAFGFEMRTIPDAQLLTTAGL